MSETTQAERVIAAALFASYDVGEYASLADDFESVPEPFINQRIGARAASECEAERVVAALVASPDAVRELATATGLDGLCTARAPEGP